MMRGALLAGLCAAPALAQDLAQDLAPEVLLHGLSGLPLRVIELRHEAETLHLRLLYEGIAPLSFAMVEPDLDPLCAQALPEATMGGQIVVAISDRRVPFGETVPDAVQFFEYYDATAEGCVWRAF